MYLAKSLAEKLYLFQVIVGSGSKEGKQVLVGGGSAVRGAGQEPWETPECDRMAFCILMVGLNSLSFPESKASQEAEPWSVLSSVST